MNRPEKTTSRPRRTWPQRIGRAAVMVVLLVGSAWVTLPWWLPTEMIRQRLEADLSRQLGAKVILGSLRTRWSGVTIHQLRINAGNPARPMLSVPRIECSFSPWDLLLARRIDWMEVHRPVITLRRSDGRLNFETLTAPEPMDIGSLSVRQGRVIVIDGANELTLRISDMQVRQEPGSKLGQITMTAWLNQPGRAAPLSLRIASRQGAEVGEVALGFWDVDLGELPLAGNDRAVRAMTGRARGTLRLAVNPNLEVTRLGLEVLAEGLAITPASGRQLPVLDRAGLTIATQIDPAGRVMEVSSLRLRLPGLDLTGRANIFPDILSAGLDSIASLDLAGRIDPHSLRELLQSDQPAAEPQLALTGPIDLNLSLSHAGAKSSVRLALDATPLQLAQRSTLLKPAGEPLRLKLQWQDEGRGEPCIIDQARLETSYGAVTALGQLKPARLGPAVTIDSLRDILALTRRLELRGRVFTGTTSARRLRGRWVLEPATQPRLTLSTLWPVGENTLSADAAVTIDPQAGLLRNATALLTLNQAELRWQAETIALPEHLDQPTQFTSQWTLDRAGALQPMLATLLPNLRAQGSARGSAEMTLGPKPRLEATIDGRELTLHAEPWLVKPAGADLQARLDLTADPTDDSPLALRGWLELPPLAVTLNGSARSHADLRGEITLRCQDLATLPPLSPALAERLGSGRLNGSAELELTGHVTSKQIDASANLRSGPVRWTRPGEPGQTWQIEPMDIRLVGTLNNPTDAPRLAGEARFLQGKIIGPDKTTHHLTGRVHLQAKLPKPSDPTWPEATLDFDRLTGLLGGKDVLLDGTVDLAGLTLGQVDRPELNRHGEPTGQVVRQPTLQALDRMDVPKLEYRIGSNHGFIEARLESLHRSPRGELTLLAERLDPREISQWLGPAAATPRPSFTAGRLRGIASQARDLIRRGRNYLADSAVAVTVTAGQFVLYDAKVDTELTTNQMGLALQTRGQAIELRYSGGYAGGALRGLLETRLDVPLPRLTQQATIDQIKATPRVGPMISRDFPGNTVNGHFSRIESLEIPLDAYLGQMLDPRYPMHPVGTAKLVATDGVVVGPGAPAFVTRVFPGLNLTEYRYDRMTAFSTYLPDGTAENETIFSGRYDVYMEGTTAADGEAKYTLGLVLLGGSRADWQHDWKQGRIPLLNYRGRIVNGKFLDRVVRYPWPNQTLGEIFIRNNIIYRAWINMDKPRPASKPAD